MKKIITVVTATRAEYGLLRPLIFGLKECGSFEVRIVVTGAHLAPEFGLTYQEIEKDGVEIHRKIDILLSGDSPAAISKSMGMALIGFADYFQEYPCDALIVLGDRYETMAVCMAAGSQRIPIVHLHGGETTEGAMDEAIRHSITKMSYLHFTSCETYRKRVIQLGESPERVYNVGALGVENCLHAPLMSVEELMKDLQFPLRAKEYAVVTFHPVTLEDNSAKEQIFSLVRAMEKFPKLSFIITKANADAGGRTVNRIWDRLAQTHPNWLVVTSLGMKRYLSALKGAAFMIGNSSSGILEGPAMKIPTVNIGSRQRGRIMAKSVFSCPPETEKIVQTMQFALSAEGQALAHDAENPFGDGNTSQKIVQALVKTFCSESKFLLDKKFYDVDFEV